MILKIFIFKSQDCLVKLKKDDGISKEVNFVPYQSIVDNLLYAAITICPDIARVVRVVGKFNCKPTKEHLITANKI